MTPIFLFIILFSQPIYLDEAGEQMVTLNIVDEIVSDDGKTFADGLWTLNGNNMYIVEGQFSEPSVQGCTTFMHERYHAIHGDWFHEKMPYTCHGVW